MSGLSQMKAVPILWSRPDKRGLYPVKIRLTIAGDRDYIPCNFSLAKEYWSDKKELVKEGHPQAENYNRALMDLQQQISKKKTELSLSGASVTAKTFKELVINKSEKTLNFFDFVSNVIDEKILGSAAPGSVILYKRYLGYIQEFCGGSDLAFSEIDRNFLVRLEKYLHEKYKRNTVLSVWKIFMSWINAAVEQRVIDGKPFAKYKQPQSEETQKEYLSFQEIDELEKFADDPRKPKNLRRTATWFLLGCLTGLRVSDWKAFSIEKNIVGNELRIRALKNGEYVSLPLSARLKRNIERIKNNARGTASLSASAFNKHLTHLAKDLKWNKHISTHCARKTFAVTLCASLGIPVHYCAELMGITVDVCIRHYYVISKPALHKEVLGKWEDAEVHAALC